MKDVKVKRGKLTSTFSLLLTLETNDFAEICLSLQRNINKNAI